MWLRTLLLGGALTIALAGSASAQKRAPPDERNARKTLLVYTDDEAIEGGFARPGQEVVQGDAHKRRFSSLIKIREDFLPELRKSAERM